MDTTSKPSATSRTPDPCLERTPDHKVAPVVDRNRCEAKGACVSVCPYHVFDIRTLEPAQRAALSVRGRLKAWAHGYRQAYVARPDACHACKLCVDACPENALRLEPLG